MAMPTTRTAVATGLSRLASHNDYSSQSCWAPQLDEKHELFRSKKDARNAVHTMFAAWTPMPCFCAMPQQQWVLSNT
jgi:hypothetical protein